MRIRDIGLSFANSPKRRESMISSPQRLVGRQAWDDPTPRRTSYLGRLLGVGLRWHGIGESELLADAYRHPRYEPAKHDDGQRAEECESRSVRELSVHQFCRPADCALGCVAQAADAR